MGSARDSLDQLTRPSMLKVLLPIGVLIFGAGSSFALWGVSHPTKAQVRGIAVEVVTAAVNEHDHGSPKPLPGPPMPPQRGFAAELADLRIEQRSMRDDLKTLREANDLQRQFIEDQYRWRVRWQASDAEPDRRKRAKAGNDAEDRFDILIKSGVRPDVAARRVLEVNPYR